MARIEPPMVRRQIDFDLPSQVRQIAGGRSEGRRKAEGECGSFRGVVNSEVVRIPRGPTLCAEA
jgi:hypothetical protein